MTTTEIVPVSGQPLATTNRPQSAAQIRANVNLIQEVMRAVMKEGTHYGKIPGTDKNSLWKPGAEVLLSTFRIAIDPFVEEFPLPDGGWRFRVTARATAMSDGTPLGSAMGEASTDEEKYRWRSAVCKEEFETTPPDRKRTKFKRGKAGSSYTVDQVRTEPADISNTVLKMAAKRAEVAVTLRITAASDIFSQDIEDLPDELTHDLAEGDAPPPASAQSMPKPKAQTTPPPTDDSLGSEPLTVKSVRSYTGTKKAGGSYTVYYVMLSNEVECGTFDKKLADAAEMYRASDTSVFATYHKTEKGVALDNIEAAKE